MLEKVPDWQQRMKLLNFATSEAVGTHKDLYGQVLEMDWGSRKYSSFGVNGHKDATKEKQNKTGRNRVQKNLSKSICQYNLYISFCTWSDRWWTPFREDQSWIWVRSGRPAGSRRWLKITRHKSTSEQYCKIVMATLKGTLWNSPSWSMLQGLPTGTHSFDCLILPLHWGAMFSH